METSTGPEEALRCSFCRKPQDAVAKLISSPGDYPRAHICNECVDVCCSILGYTFAFEADPANSANNANAAQEGAFQ
jgi:ATP-dependent Clp protease ATP-binding subunit ClpX